MCICVRKLGLCLIYFSDCRPDACRTILLHPDICASAHCSGFSNNIGSSNRRKEKLDIFKWMVKWMCVCVCVCIVYIYSMKMWFDGAFGARFFWIHFKGNITFVIIQPSGTDIFVDTSQNTSGKEIIHFLLLESFIWPQNCSDVCFWLKLTNWFNIYYNFEHIARDRMRGCGR